MPVSPSHRNPWAALRGPAVLVVVVILLGSRLTASSAGDLQTQIAAARSAAGALQTQIAADSRQIAGTTGGLREARARLAQVQHELDVRVSRLRSVQTSLLAARTRLIYLENRLHRAAAALASNLVASYEGSAPDLMTVVVDSHGFGDLLEQVGYMSRIAHEDTRVLSLTRAARAAVSGEATSLAALETRDRALATQILSQRNQAAALQSALRREQITELAVRTKASTRYQAVDRRLTTLERRAAAIQRQAAEQAVRAAATGNANVGGIAVDTGAMVQPPAAAPPAIGQVIAAGNAIATLPYIYGGGHASFRADGYDCSGSVSYALAAAGLVSAPMVSGEFETWGDPGPGRWITIYANAGHVWMTVAGWRFDTVALADSGTRWAQGGGELSGFVVRHPAGL